jgi:AraC family transcriptional regulator
MSDFERGGPARGGIIARHFRLPGFQSITSSSLKSGSLAVTRLTSETGDVEITNRIPVEKAWIISHQLKDLRHHEIWKHGNMKVATGFRSGTTSAVHLEEEPQAHLPHDYDCLSFHAPDLVLRELAELEEMPVFEGLMGSSAEVDPVIVALSRSFLPLLGAPENVPHLLADHLMIAFCAHLIGTYGSTPRKPPRAGEPSSRNARRRRCSSATRSIQGRLRRSRQPAACHRRRSRGPSGVPSECPPIGGSIHDDWRWPGRCWKTPGFP